MLLHYLKKGYAKNTVGLLIAGLALTGCGDRVSLAEAEMQKIQQQPAQPITPPPQPQKIEDFVYGSNNAKPPRDPFVPQSLIELQARVANMPSVRPDENRPKEPLEAFDLSSLIYRGKGVATDGQQYGLVQTPDGLTHNVQVGQYMGKNHGRIVEITSTQINLIEIVEDTRLGYVEKSANLVSPE